MASATTVPKPPGRGPWRLLRWTGAGLLLAVPWLAMQVTDAVHWTGSDFAVFGAMLGAALGGYELATLGSPLGAYRLAAAIALVTAFLLLWINLAVGIIGAGDDPANLMFDGVLAVGLVGAILARGRPHGLARALAATALAHAAVAAIAAAGGWMHSLVPNAVFVALWLVSARLFRVAAATASRPDPAA